MAHRGFNAFGVDLDETALTIARELADEEGVSPGFVLGDAADFSQSHGAIDIAIAFDIFEHLFDDQLGAMLVALRRQLAPGGSLVFHTFPSELDYLLFWGDERAAAFLEPFKDAEPAHFDRLVKTYAAMRNAWEVLNTGQTHSEKIAPTSHPNPLSAERLRAILERAGYELELYETGQLYGLEPEIESRFEHQPITHRNIWGVAHPRA